MCPCDLLSFVFSGKAARAFCRAAIPRSPVRKHLLESAEVYSSSLILIFDPCCQTLSSNLLSLARSAVSQLLLWAMCQAKRRLPIFPRSFLFVPSRPHSVFFELVIPNGTGGLCSFSVGVPQVLPRPRPRRRHVGIIAAYRGGSVSLFFFRIAAQSPALSFLFYGQGKEPIESSASFESPVHTIL